MKYVIKTMAREYPGAKIVESGSLVVNATGTRIPNVFYVDTDTGEVVKAKSRWCAEAGKEVVTVEFHQDETGKVTKKYARETVVVPGVRVLEGILCQKPENFKT